MNQICPVCEDYKTVKKYGQNSALTLYECQDCLFAFQDRKIYVSPYNSIDYYDPKKQPRETYPLKPDKTDLDRIMTLQKVLTNGKILEVGGGLGRTSIMAYLKGFDVTVTEESKLAVNNGEKFHPQLNWIQTSIIPDHLKDKSFDVLMMFHVLEHIPALKPFLFEAIKVLKDKSYFIVEVPNWMSLVRRFKKMRWQYVVDHHPNQFSKKALLKLFHIYGFKPVLIEYRRTFAINEKHSLKESFKKILSMLGFANVIRITFKKAC